MTKRPLTEEEKQEARRLTEAWRRYKTENPGATQAWLASVTELGTQGAVGQYLRGIIPLNVKALLAICRQIGVDPSEISERLTRDVTAGPVSASEEGARILSALAKKVDSEDDLRILLRFVMDEEPTEIPEHIRDSVRAMVRTLRNLIQKSAEQEHK